MNEQITSEVSNWFFSHAPNIAIILMGAYVLRKLGILALSRFLRHLVKPAKSPRSGTRHLDTQREATIIQIIKSTYGVIIWIIAIMMVLAELGITIQPLIAGAGIAGVALGFGGQYLIRDLLAGLFIIFENQYRVGDVVRLNDSVDGEGTIGSVEEITLRITILRDLDGTVHHIPNGEIKKASNLSKGFSRINFHVSVSYASDIDIVAKVINKVGADLAADEEWGKYIVNPPHFLRIEEFADSAVVVRILGDTKPLKQWDVLGEMRLRLLKAFKKEGIEIPFPQRVIHQVNSKT